MQKNKSTIEELGDIDPQDKRIIYDASFYREGWNFPRTWEPYADSQDAIVEQFMDYNKYCLDYVSYCLDNPDNNIISIRNEKNISDDFMFEIPLSFFDE